MQELTRPGYGARPKLMEMVRANKIPSTCRGIGDACRQVDLCNTGSPSGDRSADQLAARERKAGADWDGGELRSTDEAG